MSSEIGDKALVRGIGDNLGVIDVRSGPSRLSTDEINVTYDVTQGGWFRRTTARATEAGTSPGAAATYRRSLLGRRDNDATAPLRDNISSALSTATPPIAPLETRVQALSCTLAMDAAGAAATLGMPLSLLLSLRPRSDTSDPGTPVYFHRLVPWHIIQNGVLIYLWSNDGFMQYTTSFDPVVPSNYIRTRIPPIGFGQFLQGEVLLNNGVTNFPANTTIAWDISVIQVRKNTELPE